MRYASEHKQQTRDKVLRAAARAIRSDGPDQVGIASVMAEAGFTHGGFYAHFASKDELVAAAIERMFDGALRRWEHESKDRPPAAALSRYVDFYLSSGHRDARDRGCPAAALASDFPRLPLAARERFSDGSRRLVDALAATMAALGRRDPVGDARSMLAELVGALTLARSLVDPALSDATLAASRQAIKSRFGLEDPA